MTWGGFSMSMAGRARPQTRSSESTGAWLVGRRTQDVEDRLQAGFYGGAFRGPFFVLRHDPPAQPPVVKGVTGQFLSMGIEDAVTRVKRAADGANVVVLGANVARQCLEAGLLDEIIVHIAPVLVGGGVHLVREPRRHSDQAQADFFPRRGGDHCASLRDPRDGSDRRNEGGQISTGQLRRMHPLSSGVQTPAR